MLVDPFTGSHFQKPFPSAAWRQYFSVIIRDEAEMDPPHFIPFVLIDSHLDPGASINHIIGGDADRRGGSAFGPSAVCKCHFQGYR